MALIKCKECGEEISKKAEQCPKCGAPGKKKIGFFKWLFIIFVVLVIIGIIVPEPETRNKVSGSIAPKNTTNAASTESKQTSQSSSAEEIVKIGDTF